MSWKSALAGLSWTRTAACTLLEIAGSAASTAASGVYSMSSGHRAAFDAPTSWSRTTQPTGPIQLPRESVSDRFCRLIDIALAIPLLIFILPLMVAVGLVCWAHDGGPAFYAQPRIGRGGVMFPCFKFRSMVVDADRRLQELLQRD